MAKDKNIGTDSINSEAQDFLERSGLAEQYAGQLSPESIERSARSIEELSKEPVKVAGISYFLWGGGFAYLDKPLTATVAFLSVFVFASLWLSVWIFVLQAQLPASFSFVVTPMAQLGEMIVSSGFMAHAWAPSLLGWMTAFCYAMSIVIPVALVTPSYYVAPASIVWYILAIPFTFMAQYLRGAFVKGHLQVMVLSMLTVCLVHVAAFYRLAQHAGSVFDSVSAEKWLLLHVLLVAFFLLLIFLAMIGNAKAVFVEVGWLSKKKKGSWFDLSSLLMSAVLLVVGGIYALSGSTGTYLRTELSKAAWLMQDNGFVYAPEKLRQLESAWQNAIAPIDNIL